MTNLDQKDAAVNKLKNDFLSRFTDGNVEKDEQLKIDAYEKCIQNIAEANLTLVSSVAESSFEPKLFVKRGDEEEKVIQDDVEFSFSMLKKIKSNKSILEKSMSFIKKAIKGKHDQLLCL
jgi:hypothetical protein